MTENFENNVANGVATKKKYVSPEIEVINLDAQPQLLAQSATRSFGAGFADDNEEDW
ncbi:MAG: hypothetical protein II480_05475 [Bacteroidales bacterium]|nr:hypothetical protein [Bacteroidales bacterium]